jgi:hypothetical protein
VCVFAGLILTFLAGATMDSEAAPAASALLGWRTERPDRHFREALQLRVQLPVLSASQISKGIET